MEKNQNILFAVKSVIIFQIYIVFFVLIWYTVIELHQWRCLYVPNRD